MERSQTFSPQRIKKVNPGINLQLSSRYKSIDPDKIKQKDSIPDVVSASCKKIEIDYETEFKILEKAHRLLSSRSAINKTNPLAKVKEFVDYTNVKEIIEDQNKPVQQMVPKLEKIIMKVEKQISIIQSHQQRLDDKIGMLSNKVRDVDTMFDTVTKLVATQETEISLRKAITDANCAGFRSIEQKNHEFREEINKFYKRMKKQDEKIAEFREEVNKNRAMAGEEFNRWCKDQTQVHRDLQLDLEKSQMMAHKVDQGLKQFIVQNNKQMKYKDVLFQQFEKAQEEQIDLINRKMKQHGAQLVTLAKLNGNMDALMKDMAVGRNLTLFCSQSLPLLIHLQICEGLRNVVGPEFSKELAVFEQAKVEEIDSYIKTKSSGACFKIMHERLLVLNKFFKENKKGVLDFTFGQEVFRQMTPHEIQYIAPDICQRLNKKAMDFQEAEFNFEQALKQAQIETHKQSEPVLKHKLKKLEPSQLIQLQKIMTCFKVIEKGITDDVLPSPRGRKEPSGHFMDKYRDKHPGMEQIVMPDKIFVLQRDRMLPCKRLDHKFQSLYDNAMKIQQQYRNVELENFAKCTRMVIQLSNEVQVVKDVIETMQMEFEEYSKVQKQTFEAYQKEFDQNQDKNHKKHETLQTMINQSRENQRNIQKMVYEFQSKQEKDINEVKFSNTLMRNNMEEFQKHKEEIVKKTEHIQESMTIQINELMEQNNQAINTGIQTAFHNRRSELSDQKKPSSVPNDSNNVTPNTQDIKIASYQNTSERQDESIVDFDEIRKKNSSKEKKLLTSLDVTNIDGDDVSQQSQRNLSKRSATEHSVRCKAPPDAHSLAQAKRHLIQQKIQDDKEKKEAKIKEKIREREEREAKKVMEKEIQKNEEERLRHLEQKKEEIRQKQELKQKEKAMLMKIFKSQSRVSLMGDDFMKGLAKGTAATPLSKFKAAVARSIQRASTSPDAEGFETVDSKKMSKKQKDVWKVLDFDGQYNQKKFIDEERVHQIFKPILDEIYAQIASNRDKINGQVEQLRNIHSQFMEKNTCQICTINDEIQAFKALTESHDCQHKAELTKTKNELKFELKNIIETMELEKSEIFKMKHQIKLQMSNEISTLKGQEMDTVYDIQRLNLIVEQLGKGIRLLSQDAMMMQMIQEQDVIDRKQIGLFGVKKNQQILGTNQYAVQNNYVKSHESTFMSLRNKNQDYNSVVASPNTNGQNIRGLDLKMSDKHDVQDIISTELHDKDEEVKFDKQFINRYNQNQDYNTISVDRGFSPQMVQMAKQATLNYTNQPVTYRQMELKFEELLQVKEYVLQSASEHFSELDRTFGKHQSKYGVITPHQNNSMFSKAAKTFDASEENEETHDLSKFLTSVQQETEAKTNLSNQSPKLMNINSSQYCNLTSSGSVPLEPQNQTVRQADQNEKFEIEILSQIATSINLKEDGKRMKENIAKVLDQLKTKKQQRQNQSMQIHLKTQKLKLSQLKEERLKTYNFFANQTATPCSPVRKNADKVNVSAYSIKLARPQHSRNKGGESLNALSQEFNLTDGLKLQDQARRKVNITKQSQDFGEVNSPFQNQNIQSTFRSGSKTTGKIIKRYKDGTK